MQCGRHHNGVICFSFLDQGDGGGELVLDLRLRPHPNVDDLSPPEIHHHRCPSMFRYNHRLALAGHRDVYKESELVWGDIAEFIKHIDCKVKCFLTTKVHVSIRIVSLCHGSNLPRK